MKLLIPIFVLLFFTLLECKLIQVQIINRHGDRTPYTNGSLPKDPVDFRKYFGLEPGQLTGLGMTQAHQLGVQLRNLYISENATKRIEGISTQWNTLDYKFQSSSYDRTLQTAWAIAYGMFPLGTGLKNELTKNFSLPSGAAPVPVHTMKQMNDLLLKGWMNCPGLEDMFEEHYESEEFKEKEKYYKPLIEKLQNLTGLPEISFREFYEVDDIIIVQMAHNLLKIKEIIDEYPKIREMGDYCHYQKFRREVVGNVAIGFLGKEILKEMEKAVEGKQFTKFLLYSGHDTTISSALSAWKLASDHKELQILPPYASSIAFELHQNDDGQFFVRVFFQKGHDGGYKQYKMESLGCDDIDCKWEQFKKGTEKDAIPNNYCYVCKNVDTDVCIAENLGILQVWNIVLSSLAYPSVLAIVVVIILLIVVILQARKIKKLQPPKETPPSREEYEQV